MSIDPYLHFFKNAMNIFLFWPIYSMISIKVRTRFHKVINRNSHRAYKTFLIVLPNELTFNATWKLVRNIQISYISPILNSIMMLEDKIKIFEENDFIIKLILTTVALPKCELLIYRRPARKLTKQKTSNFVKDTYKRKIVNFLWLLHIVNLNTTFVTKNIYKNKPFNCIL